MAKRLPTALAVFLITFIAYSPTLFGKFYYDDNIVFFGHQAKVLAEDPFSVFSGETHYLPGAPRSIHVFFLLLIFKAFGAAPLPYHVFNLLMHSVTTVLVFVLLRRVLSAGQEETRLTPEEVSGNNIAALMGGLIFGLHPVHVENITFVTLGGTDLFYTFWALMSLLCYVWFRDRRLPGKLNFTLVAVSALFYYFALLSKESAIAFVLVYPATELVLRRKGFLWALPHAAVLLFSKRGLMLDAAPSVVRQVAEASPGGAGPGDIIKSLGFYAKSLFVPYPHMSFIKEFPDVTLLYAFAALAALWLLAGIVLRRRILAYSSIWFFVVSVPYVFVPAAAKNVAITAERYVYAPSVALAILGAWTLAVVEPGRIKHAFRYLLALVLIIYVVLGAVYFFEAWRSEEAFWEYAIKINPDYVSGYVGLAAVELDQGRIGEARELLVEGLGKEKGMPEEFSTAAYTLGDIYRREGDLARAEMYYLRSVNYSGYEFSFIQLGFLYLDSGRYHEARRAFESALKYRQSPRSLVGMAITMLRLGDKQKAGYYAMRAYELSRDPRLKDYAAGVYKEATK